VLFRSGPSPLSAAGPGLVLCRPWQPGRLVWHPSAWGREILVAGVHPHRRRPCLLDLLFRRRQACRRGSGEVGGGDCPEVPVITLCVCDRLHRPDAPTADRRVLRTRTNVRLPVPATLAFLAVSLGDGDRQLLIGSSAKF